MQMGNIFKQRVDKKTLRVVLGFGMLCMCIMMAGCGGEKEPEDTEKIKVTEPAKDQSETQTEPVTFEEDGETFESTEEYVYTTSKLNVRKACSTDAEVVKMLPERAKVLRIAVGDTWSKISIAEGEYYVATEYLTAEEPELSGHLIAIDAGHQEKANEEKEPIGPGAAETKAKNSIGTRGVSSGVYEYQLTLQVAQKLKEELTSRGYEVLLIRESNDFNMSNQDRAKMAGESGAEVLIHLHANGSKVEETNGAMTICCTEDSPYIPDLYADSHRLAKDILNHFVEETGAQSKGVWETDVMSGINWSTIPVATLEMGFMSNVEEDQRMQTDDYQKKMVSGIADGLDAYFE